jgi:ubiquinone biosynthesis protein
VFTTWHQTLALLAGGFVARVRARREEGAGRGFRFALQRLLAATLRLTLDRDLRDRPFAVQLRRRLERLGPTYIKLGQILSLREDLLPRTITNELKYLLDRLPAVPMEAFQAIVERELDRPLETAFLWVDPTPLGSASIGQTHRATTRDGDAVIIKIVKPGVRETLERDAKLLRALSSMLQAIIPQYQPRKLVHEFCDYTLREVDLRREADNAETFAGNFRDMPEVAFPAIYRPLSGRDVLTMEYFDGIRPDKPAAQAMPEEERRRLTDIGAASIIRMLYRDGFFHADLHPGNLLILPGPRCGFIDLGMVGRLDEELRRTLLYYYFSLVMGDAENAARYLAAAAEPGPGANPKGFLRDVTEIGNRWRRSSSFEDYSLGQLILDSVSRGAQYRMYFPVEMVLMVKALVTFEGVGHVLLPGFDVAEVSKRHIRSIFFQQFSPVRLFSEGMRGTPDLVEAMVKMPLLMTEGLRVLEKMARKPPENPLSGIRSTLLAGSCLVAAAIAMGFGARWPVWAALFAAALLLAMHRG